MSPSVSIRFPVTATKLALAMALEARDEEAFANLDDGSAYGEEAPEFEVYVRRMSKARALTALKSAYRAYGELSFPEDYPSQAYAAALEKARGWLG